MKYNIENRAFKEIDRQAKKPLVAPKHEAGIIDYHKSLKGLQIFSWNCFLFISVLIE